MLDQQISSRWVPKRVFASIFVLLLLSLIYPLIGSHVYHRSFVDWFKDDKRRLLDLITIWLASSGILYAWVHDYRLSRQSENIDAQLRRLQKIEETTITQLEHLSLQNQELRRIEGSLSTRRTGHFPDYVSKISRIATETTHSLDILADCVDYGSFFAPEAHRRAHEAICKAAGKDGVKVRIVVCGPPQTFTATSGRSSEDYVRNYEEIKGYLGPYLKRVQSDHGFKKWMSELLDPSATEFEKLKKWLVECDSPVQGTSIEVLSRCAAVCAERAKLGRDANDQIVFTTLLQVRQKWFADLLSDAGAEIRYVGNRERIFLWIKDKNVVQNGEKTECAVFTFPSAGHGKSQLGYETHDPDLLRTFESIFKENWGSE